MLLRFFLFFVLPCECLCALGDHFFVPLGGVPLATNICATIGNKLMTAEVAWMKPQQQKKRRKKKKFRLEEKTTFFHISVVV